MNKIKIKTGLEKPYRITVDTSTLKPWVLNEKIIKILERKLKRWQKYE